MVGNAVPGCTSGPRTHEDIPEHCIKSWWSISAGSQLVALYARLRTSNMARRCKRLRWPPKWRTRTPPVSTARCVRIQVSVFHVQYQPRPRAATKGTIEQ